jgi:hypothetical protein
MPPSTGLPDKVHRHVHALRIADVMAAETER